MSEYEFSGYMKELPDKIDELEDDTTYFMPHRAILKKDSITTKCRIVFDVSAKTKANLSLSDFNFSRPPSQDELLNVFLRF